VGLFRTDLDIPSPVLADSAYAVEWIQQEKTRLMNPYAGIVLGGLTERRFDPGRSVDNGCCEPSGSSL
jgi:hypothetical protein